MVSGRQAGNGIRKVEEQIDLLRNEHVFTGLDHYEFFTIRRNVNAVSRRSSEERRTLKQKLRRTRFKTGRCFYLNRHDSVAVYVKNFIATPAPHRVIANLIRNLPFSLSGRKRSHKNLKLSGLCRYISKPAPIG